MKNQTQNQIIESSLDWRYAVKKFDPSRKISDEDWKTLTQSLLKSPSSYGLQPWKFLVIENPKLREDLKASSFNQTQVTDASHIVVFVTRDSVENADVRRYIDRIATVRDIPKESLKGFEDMMTQTLVSMKSEVALQWTQRQAYIAMGFLLETAAILKIDATPMEGLQPAAYDKILGLEESGYKTVAVVALGYRHQDDSFQKLRKVRFEESDVIQYR